MISTTNLSKTFRIFKKEEGFAGSLKSLLKRTFEDKVALNGATLQIKEGEIVGLVGSNGAGKTTLVKLLSGIIHPTSGEVSVLGFKPFERKNEFRKQIGLLMGQKAQLWWDLPAADCFLLLKEIYSIPERNYKKLLGEISEALQVTQLLNVPIRKLSLGERMKMELISVLLHTPKVIFLDEPTIGLDFSAQKAIRKFLLEYSAEYKPAMLITSHYMQDIEELCKRIVIIRNGSFVYDGLLEAVKEKYAKFRYITAELGDRFDDQSAKLLSSKNISTSAVDGNSIKVRVQKEQVSQTMQTLLSTLEIKDLSVEEEDIAEIIEALMTKAE